MAHREPTIVHVHERTRAPVDAVWRLVADGRGWHRWTTIKESTLEREGVPAPDGVGAIRRFRVGLGVSREEVTVFDPPYGLSYRLLSGLPVTDYSADIVLSPDGDGTQISWTGRFHAKYLGTTWALRVFMTFVLRRFARGLGRYAEETRGL